MSTETVVRERPILFSGPMVRALLDGRKTQTRRVVVPQPTDGVHPCHWVPSGWAAAAAPNEHGVVGCTCREIRCPYGAPGDRLWVKEGIRFVGATAMGDLSEYEADGALTKADGWPWQRARLASIHCPRGLSRLTLEITDVRVQRVQEISEDDAWAEGTPGCARPGFEMLIGLPRAGARFRSLWDSINAARGYGWDVNPWVWALTFRRVEVET